MGAILKDKRVYLNILALIVAVAGPFGFTGELPENWALFVPAIVAVINMGLHLFVKQPIAGELAAGLRGE